MGPRPGATGEGEGDPAAHLAPPDLAPPDERGDDERADDEPRDDGVATGSRHVMRGSMWYVASVMVGAGLSFVFWGLAAHVASQSQIGTATALFASVLFWNYVTGMGLPVAVARYGSAEGRNFNALFTWAVTYTTATSVIGTLAFAVGAMVLTGQRVYLDTLFQWGVPVGLVIFFLLIAGIALALLVEIRLVTLRRWNWVFTRVLLISLVRFPLLFVPAIGTSPMGLLLLIAGTPALSGFIGVAALRYSTPKSDRGRLFPRPDGLVAAWWYASVNYVGMLAAQAPQFMLPIVLAATVSANDFGAFFLAWQVTTVVFLVPHTISQVVLSEGSRDAAHMNHQVRAGLRISLALMIVAAIGAYVFRNAATLVFGPDYTLTATLLPWFVAAGVPWAVTSMYLARARVAGNHAQTVVITWAFALLTLVPSTIASINNGAVGASYAWLVGNVLAAVAALVATAWVKPSGKTGLVGSAPRTSVAEPA